MITPQIISEGTLKTEDLVEAQLAVLNSHRDALNEREKQKIEAIEKSKKNEELTAEDVEELDEIIAENVAPYCYTGTTEGDGACFGVLVDHEQIREDIVEVVEEDENGGGVYRLDTGYTCVVSDHGNVTLIDSEEKVVWSVV